MTKRVGRLLPSGYDEQRCVRAKRKRRDGDRPSCRWKFGGRSMYVTPVVADRYRYCGEQ
jgi:hypothetical protein